VDLYAGNANAVIPQVADGRLTALAVTGLPQLPQVPTADETISKQLEMVAWSGLVAPHGTPAEVVEILAGTAEKVFSRPALQGRIEEVGAKVRWSGPQAYGRLIEAELDRWGAAVRIAGVRLE
jgi:tripartite-type tricarboxylate transporter receptor subunit TctC